MCLKGMNVSLTEVILRVWFAEQAAKQQQNQSLKSIPD